MTRETARSLARIVPLLEEEARRMPPGPWKQQVTRWARVANYGVQHYEGESGEAVSAADDDEELMLSAIRSILGPR